MSARLAGVAALPALPTAALPDASQPLALASVAELRAGFLAREFTPSEVLAAVLDRATRFAALTPFITIDEQGATDAARRADAIYAADPDAAVRDPLLGVPITVKDLIWTRDLRTTRGSLVTENFVPDRDAPAVSRLRAAGAVIVGKTNTSEGGWKGDAGNRLVGPSANPWNPSYTAGGSSGGAGVAAALGLGAIAVGTDGGGSVRIPASFCGVVGFKPSFGAIPYVPACPEGLSHIGPLTRTVADAAIAVEIMSGYDPADSMSTPGQGFTDTSAHSSPRLRVRVASSLGFARAGAAQTAATHRTAEMLAERGHEVVHSDLDLPDLATTMMTLWAGHEAPSYGDDLASVAELLDPGLLALIEYGRTLTARQLAQAHSDRAAIRAQLHAALDGFDVLLTPTMPEPAFALGNDAPPSASRVPITGLDWTPFTYLLNLTGWPAISLPAGVSEAGLPLGVQLVGRLYDDARVLSLARDIEAASDWRSAYPHLNPTIHP
ncbi:amidase [Leucobacter albus]|uniref:Amidase n=1 Tax=Leucobacter albus TaxID=272210 RepID=A0ABW3TN49_9MICO